MSIYYNKKEKPEYLSSWARPIDDLYDNKTMPAVSQQKPVKKRVVLDERVISLFDSNSI